jgi:hypothetical protein
MFDIDCDESRVGMDNNPCPRDYGGERQSRLADKRIRSLSDIRPSRCQGTCRHTELRLLPCLPVGGSLFDSALYHGLACTTVAGVLPRNLLKIQSQDLPSVLYASKRCSSTASHGIFILVLKPYLSSPEHRSSSLLRLGSAFSLSLPFLILGLR